MTVVFRILVVIPSSPEAFVTSSDFKADLRSANFICTWNVVFDVVIKIDCIDLRIFENVQT